MLLVSVAVLPSASVCVGDGASASTTLRACDVVPPLALVAVTETA